MVMNADAGLASFLEAGARTVADWFGNGVRWLTGKNRHSWMVNSGLMNRLVAGPVQDSLSLGWSTQDGTEADVTQALDKALQLEERALDVGIAARTDGGAWWWVVLRNDLDFTVPLGPGPHEVAAVHVVTRTEARPLTWNRDLESPDLGRPELVTVTMVRDGLASPTAVVHASRLIYVAGIRALPSQSTGGDGYDLSAVQLYEPAVRALERAWEAGADLLERMSMPVLSIKGTAALEKDKDGYARRIRNLIRAMATKGLMVIMGDDALTWMGPSLAGYGEAITEQKERVSAVEGRPLSKVFGQAPSGLSTDDTAGTRTHYDWCDAYRRTVLTPMLQAFYDIALGPSGDREIVWPSLHKPTRLEAAQIGQLNAARDQALATLTAIMPGESRARFAGGVEVDLPVLDPAYDIIPAEALAQAERDAARDAALAAMSPFGGGGPGVKPGDDPDASTAGTDDEDEDPADTEDDDEEPEDGAVQ